MVLYAEKKVYHCQPQLRRYALVRYDKDATYSTNEMLDNVPVTSGIFNKVEWWRQCSPRRKAI
jgi:hypothetical protein